MDDRYEAFMKELRDLLRRYDAEIGIDTVGWGNHERDAFVVGFRDGIGHILPKMIDGKEPAH